jgi:capsular exopolysaccharide synthesis family protein
MTQENNDQSIDSLFGRQVSSSSFDFATLLSKVLKYWMLFVLFLIAALALAYLKNKSWTPTYKIATTILIEDSRSALRNDFTSGYSSMGYGNRNFNNQMIMYNSYDFIANTVDHLNLATEIYKKQRFINTIIYKDSPISINSHYVADAAYGLEFRIRGVNDDIFEISFAGNDRIRAFRQQGKYGEPIHHALFFVEIQKTGLYINPQYDFYFHFFSKASLIGLYSSRISSRILMEGSSVIEIALTSKVKQRDLDFLNSLNEQFFHENLDRKNETADRSIKFIDEQIAILRDSIDSSEDKLNSYQLASGIYSQDQSANRSKVLEELEQQKNDIRLRKEYLKYLSKYLNNPNNELLTDPSAFRITNPQLSASISQYNALALEMRTLGSSSPILIKNLQIMEELRESIRVAIKAMNSIIALEERDNNQRYAKVREELANLPQQERQLLTHERDFKINDTYYTYLLQRRTESQIQKASNAPDNLIIDKPRVIGMVNGGERQQTYLFYALIGLLIPAIFVACKEFLFKFHIQSREEVEKITTVPILGTIEKSKKKELIAVKAYPRSGFAEGFRNLRARMEYMVKKNASTSMLVTSTEPQDGKTFVVINLAAIYQMSGKKIILVDFDLRRPALSKSLGMEENKGLSNCLIGQISVDEAIVSLEQGFDVLPAGVIPPNPSELIRTSQTKELINTLSKKYDYVILDCSPVGLVSDAHFLAHLVDIMLYVVRDEKTNKNFFKHTIHELQEDGINNMAIIYNDVNAKVSHYYGKGSYYLKHGSYYQNE